MSDNGDPVQPGTFDRLMEAYGVGGVTDLAAKIRENPSTVKNWRARGNVPLEYLVRAARDTKRSLDWLVMGPRKTQEASTSASGEGLTVRQQVARYGPVGGVIAEGRAEEEFVRLRATSAELLQQIESVGFEPGVLWLTVLQELMYAHGLTPSGVTRILETLKADSR